MNVHERSQLECSESPLFELPSECEDVGVDWEDFEDERSSPINSTKKGKITLERGTNLVNQFGKLTCTLTCHAFPFLCKDLPSILAKKKKHCEVNNKQKQNKL